MIMEQTQRESVIDKGTGSGATDNACGKSRMTRLREWLRSLSFRTGIITLAMCVPFYVLSFAQMLLPISVTAKGVLWTVFFGLAKTCQYGGLTILGVDGYKRLKDKFKPKRNE